MAKQDIIAPVSGSVWKIESEIGQQVAEGDVIMILESMKMEIPVEAPAAGKLASLSVGEGDSVEEDGVLGTVEP